VVIEDGRVVFGQVQIIAVIHLFKQAEEPVAAVKQVQPKNCPAKKSGGYGPKLSKNVPKLSNLLKKK